jgi:DNA-binding transcriptional LysR family regulator
MAIDIRLVEPFLLVCETTSITRAAERMGVAQSRLSLLIKKLEDQLGFLVFHRTHRQISLTLEGARFRDKALELAAVRKSVDELVWELRGATRARLRLGAPRYAFDLEARADLLEAFRQRWPSAKIEMCDMRTAALLDKLRAGEIDLAFCTRPFDDTGLSSLPIASTTAYLAIPEEHPLARHDRVSICDTGGFEFAVYPSLIGENYVAAWFGPFREAGAKLIEADDDHPPSLLRFAARLRCLVVVHSWDEHLPGIDPRFKMVLRPINNGENLKLSLVLTRSVGPLPAAAEGFWEIASTQRAVGSAL